MAPEEKREGGRVLCPLDSQATSEQEEHRDKSLWNFLFILFFLVLLCLSLSYFHAADRLPARIPLFDFLFLSLAVFRLTHLFVYDDITHFIQDYFRQFRRGPGKTVSNLLSCPWCTGIWMALVVTFLYFLTPILWYIIFVIALAGIGTFMDIIARRIMR